MSKNKDKSTDVFNMLIEKRNEIEQLKKEYQEKRNEIFQVLTKNIFENIPSLKSIYWNQYTPYFMDGDECRFTVYPIYFSSVIPENSTEDLDLEDDDFIYSNNSCADDNINEDNLSEAEQNLIDKFSDFMYENSTMLLDIYGDHVSIVLTKGAATVEKYDHD